MIVIPEIDSVYVNLTRQYNLMVFLVLLISIPGVFAQNPLIQDQYTADPTARVFNGKMYVYPSHDIICPEGKGRPGWFCMEDYHVFSSESLTEWTDHGVILNQTEVAWANSEGYSMWAPDCVEREGKYYFYFPTKPRDSSGFKIGVAISDSPTGPFVAQEKPIEGVDGIDPNVLIDSDGQAYLYWSEGAIYVARLKPNMTELASEPTIIANLPQEGLKEGPFVFERKGVYYLTYPHVENKIERLEYAIGPTPEGPFTVTGVIMDESPTGCWTNHQSIVNYKDQWYLFYHHNDLSPDFDKNRSIRADSLAFNQDGSIIKVEPSLRGIGVNKASEKLQLDRYSAKSKRAELQFNNPGKTFEGWNITLNSGDWVRYNKIAFENTVENVSLNYYADKASVVQLWLKDRNERIATIEIPANKKMHVQDFEIQKISSGVHDLEVRLISGKLTLDWLRFQNN